MQGFWSLFLDGLLPLGGLSFEAFFPSLFVCDLGGRQEERVPIPRFTAIVAETTSVSSCIFSLCFPLIAISLISFDADGFPFTSLFLLALASRFFFVSGLKKCEASFSDPAVSSPWIFNSGSSVAYSSARCFVRTTPIRP